LQEAEALAVVFPQARFLTTTTRRAPGGAGQYQQRAGLGCGLPQIRFLTQLEHKVLVLQSLIYL